MEEQPAKPNPDFTEQPLSPMRKLIARRMTESKTQIPHFYLTVSVDMRQAAEFRRQFNTATQSKLSYSDLIIKATALAIRKFPPINASFRGESIRFHQRIHLGIAVALTDGLVVPVLRDADQKSLRQIAAEAADLAERARNRRLKSTELREGNFTITNLGMLGIHEFAAVINPPEAAILAVGAIEPQPIVEQQQIVPGLVMKLTLACDHRVIDGAVGATFLQALKRLLEQPEQIELPGQA